MSVVSIFLLIGLSHWAAHILECEGCKNLAINNTRVVIEGVKYTFGWPIAFTRYLLEVVHKPKTGLTVEQVDAHVDAFFKAKGLPKNAQFLEIRQGEGESKEAFEARILSTIGSKIKDNQPNETK